MVLRRRSVGSNESRTLRLGWARGQSLLLEKAMGPSTAVSGQTWVAAAWKIAHLNLKF